MQLTDLRRLVRVQTETLEDELPDATIDWYLRQAYDRTMALENAWPFFEKRWTLTLPINTSQIALPTDVNVPGIMALIGPDGESLEMLDPSHAERWFGAGSVSINQPCYYSVWGGIIYLLPAMTYATTRTYRLRGYRKGSDWVAGGPSASPDCDERLHRPLVHYAIALAYAQQEDEVLENTYMMRWQQDINAIVPTIMEPRHQHPLVMGGSVRTPIGRGAGWPVYTITPPGGP